ncbi:MAG: flagellar motor switch protein FliG [Verrucomicrobia bacterium]|nr:flagellar motor switch protein FliG [Verrucomicrobiota bacterium]
MTRLQRLAVLLVILGPSLGGKFLRHFPEEEIEKIAEQMAKINLIPEEVKLEVIKEFADIMSECQASLLGGISLTQEILQNALGMFRASDIMNRVSPNSSSLDCIKLFLRMDPVELTNILRFERPQTVAMILSYFPTQKSSQIVSHLDPEMRQAVVEKMASMAPTTEEVVRIVATSLQSKVGKHTERVLNQTGGIKSAADLLNSMDKKIGKSLLIDIEENNPELGQLIRQKMFIFDDLAVLDTTVLQKVLREVDMRDLAIALKSASREVELALLGSVSKRAAETIREEMSFMGPVKAKEVESSQQRIIEVVRRLESEGEIDLSEE